MDFFSGYTGAKKNEQDSERQAGPALTARADWLRVRGDSI